MPCHFPQHLSWAAWGLHAYGREEEATERWLPFIFLSLSLSVSLLIIWEATSELKRLSLSLSLSSQCEFFLPSSASQRRVTSQHDVLCCEFSARHAELPCHFLRTHTPASLRHTVKIPELLQIRQIETERRICSEFHHFLLLLLSVKAANAY